VEVDYKLFLFWTFIDRFLFPCLFPVSFWSYDIRLFTKLLFRARYSRMMEEGFFRNKPADYVWLMLFSAGILILLSVSVKIKKIMH
jgi:Derlin-2/3